MDKLAHGYTGVVGPMALSLSDWHAGMWDGYTWPMVMHEWGNYNNVRPRHDVKYINRHRNALYNRLYHAITK